MAALPFKDSVRDSKNVDLVNLLQHTNMSEKPAASKSEEAADTRSLHQSLPYIMTAEDLRVRLETLPQELYDEIYDITFTAEHGMRPIGTKPGLALHRAHLKFLQIDPASRTSYAKSYYGKGASFRMLNGVLIDWLKSLPSAHRVLLQDVVLVSYIWPFHVPSEIELEVYMAVLQSRIGAVGGGQEVVKHVRFQSLPMILNWDDDHRCIRAREDLSARVSADLNQQGDIIFLLIFEIVPRGLGARQRVHRHLA